VPEAYIPNDSWKRSFKASLSPKPYPLLPAACEIMPRSVAAFVLWRKIGGSMHVFHGTSPATAATLASGGVNVTEGGGELGVGFYTGEYLHVAKAWAVHRYGAKRQNVVEFDVDDNAVQAFDIVWLDAGEASFTRANLKRSGTTRTHAFSCDLVWSPIVGTDKIQSDQHKWESLRSETALNSASWPKTIR
jgi:hypothetical protein